MQYYINKKCTDLSGQNDQMSAICSCQMLYSKRTRWEKFSTYDQTNISLKSPVIFLDKWKNY